MILNTYRKKLKLFLLLGFLTIVHLSNSQVVDYNKIIIPKGVNVEDLSEQLVQLAWNNHPANQILYHRYDITKADHTLQAIEFTRFFRFNFNANEYTLNLVEDIRENPYYPKYNFSINFTLNDLFGYPARTKQTRAYKEISLENIKEQKLLIRSQVLQSYNNYLMNQELLKIQLEATEDAIAQFTIVEQRFKNGESTIEDYIQSVTFLNNEKRQKIGAQNAYQNSKIELESLIGIEMGDLQ